EAFAFPEGLAALVDDAACIDDRSRAEPFERPGEPEGDELSVRNAVGAAQADQECAQAGPPCGALLSRSGAGEDHPVSVHAALRTVSFRLPAAANAAEGSNPEWIPQCSQRGSLPGPYSSHSMPSISASYVGKIPSVSR